MYEIYDRHSGRYDQLIDHEDYQGNLGHALNELAEWDGRVVAEAGVGTGRITRLYVDRAAQVFGFDRSSHMLRRARRNLARWTGKVRLARAVHDALPVADGTADIFVEGWAFGHAVTDRPGDVERVARELVAEAERVTRPGGTLVFIETLGTNVSCAGAPEPALAVFYAALEERYGFTRTVVRTDYRFETREEAVELCGFFFGEEMGRSVAAALPETTKAAGGEPGGLIVPEFTGIWSRNYAT